MTVRDALDVLMGVGCIANLVGIGGVEHLTVWKSGICLAGFPTAWITAERIERLRRKAATMNPPDEGWYVTQKGLAMLAGDLI